MKRYIKKTIKVSVEEARKEHHNHIVSLARLVVEAQRDLESAITFEPKEYAKEISIEVFPGDPEYDGASLAFDPIGSRGEVGWIETK